MPKENDILETTLSLAESSYPEAYRYLLDAYQANSKALGPQTFYFLACLAGGAGMPEQALAWLRSAIVDHAWWYRPEVLTDDDLAPLKARPEFLALKSLSDQRYADAVSRSQALFSWKGKHADSLFLAVHGNTQNGQTARADWEPILGKSNSWQLEAIQSAEPDGYGTYRWRYDGASYAAVAQAMEAMQSQGKGLCAAVFPPGAICCCARCCLPMRAAICSFCKARGFRCCTITRRRLSRPSGKSRSGSQFSAAPRMRIVFPWRGICMPQRRRQGLMKRFIFKRARDINFPQSLTHWLIYCKFSA